MSTEKYNQGYRYYVYGGPGDIHYFKTYQEAIDYQSDFGGEIGEVN